jgi:cysteine sulfinate desulfinase/cysteine desulfurase-like protein
MQSNNMVFDSVARYYAELHAEDGGRGSLPHIIISNLEHDSVDITARKMQQQGRIGEYC